MENNPDLLFLIIAGFAIFGIVASLVYYFARYYFRTTENDPELAPGQTTDISKLLHIDDAKVPVAVAPATYSSALSKTKSSFWGRISSALGDRELSEGDTDALEEILYTSDLGPMTVNRLMESVNSKLQGNEKANLEKVRQTLKTEMSKMLSISETAEAKLWSNSLPKKPAVWMIVGVNGAGKTTTIGKLAFKAAGQGKKVMVVAGDTFRAAAGEQLKVWTERAAVEIFNPAGVTDPSAVAFDGLQSAIAKGFDLVLVDTAGRLHTQSHLMDELKKVKRVMAKVMPDAPHEVLIVLDANAGQNALLQAKNFHEALGLTGVVLTKLDGTAKGGMAVAVCHELSVPIVLVGLGESIEDLQGFRPREFVDSIL